MEDLLFLSHRIPYPPDKGDKIRAFHVLRHLAERYRIHLGCFYDDPHDARYIGDLEKLCETMLCLPLAKGGALVKGAFSLLSGHSLSEGYFGSNTMRRWVADTVAKHNPSNIFVFCSAMAPYALPHLAGRTSALDLVDADSEKWRAYAKQSAWPKSMFFGAEHRALLGLELRSILAFTDSFFVSAEETALFLQNAPAASGRVHHFGNGVDLLFFDPTAIYSDPFLGNAKRAVFVGRMDYQPNIQACMWFAEAVFPKLRQKCAGAEFWIVGANPAAELEALKTHKGVHLTGRVEDVRPYVAHADCIVAPLKIARGVQNKVLEAMAMAKPVVATPEACTGLTARPGEDLLRADSAEDFCAAVLSVLGGRHPNLGANARRRVEADYHWSSQLAPLDAMFAAKSVSSVDVRRPGLCEPQAMEGCSRWSSP